MPACSENREPNDESLVNKSKNGDQEAFGLLVRRYQARVFSTCYGMLGHGFDAEEAAQEVFLRTWRAITKFDQKAAFSTWLYRITVNYCLTARQRLARTRGQASFDELTPQQQHAATMDRGDNQSNPEAAVAGSQHAVCVRRHVDRLPEDFRDAVVLVHLQQMPYPEAAAALDLPTGTVKSRVHRAIKQLQTAFATCCEAPV